MTNEILKGEFKSIRAILIISILVSFNCAFAQEAKKISIPVLKENAQIDSLMSIVLDSKTEPRFCISDLKWDGIWMVMYVGMRADSVVSFHLATVNDINYIVNNQLYKKAYSGYFKYKNINILVYPNDSLNVFFVKTPQSDMVKSIYPIEKDRYYLPFFDGIVCDYSYTYRNHHFVVNTLVIPQR